ncbi:MAG: undecaprenyl-diphosphate phosphatase [Patescibacteria group bacterium]|nr:undecaprenyl-diphosphate phosphatase [Patescibacteria group bacterium]
MSIFHSLILGLLQGITEFLPISSSGHLVLFETILKLEVETLKGFDVALHVASLLAILFYFRKKIIQIILKDQKYILWLIVGTIPAVAIGLTLEDKIDAIFRGTLAVGIVMAVTATFFLIAEKFKPQKSNLTAKKSFIIGLAQALALIPGVSRSGSTIAAGLLTGAERVKAAEFSFLLGSVAITGAGLLTALDDPQLPATQPLIAGFLASLIASYFAIKFLMYFFKKNTLKPFAYYLFAVSALTIILSLT